MDELFVKLMHTEINKNPTPKNHETEWSKFNLFDNFKHNFPHYAVKIIRNLSSQIISNTGMSTMCACNFMPLIETELKFNHVCM